MKNKIIKVLIFALVFVLIFGSVSAFAYQPYDTYTYSIDGEPLKSPPAYYADYAYQSEHMNLETPLGDTVDIFADNEGNVFLVDEENNRIVVLDSSFRKKAIISEYTDEYNRKQTFKNPKGIYVTDPTKTADKTSYIYVCDTGNSRVVVFDRSYNYVRTITKPEGVDDELIPVFDPHSIAVDIYGRIFVVSPSFTKGVIVLSSKGDFIGYIGAQKNKTNFIEQIWQSFTGDNSGDSTAVPFNNITVDDYGFIYVTFGRSEKITDADRYASLIGKTADFSPVKKLNSTGVEIMKRNGFFDPSGEVVDSFNMDKMSVLVDVALGPEGSWTILDSDKEASSGGVGGSSSSSGQGRMRLFTYDQNGNLLFAFGDVGEQLGNGTDARGITYQVVDGEYRLLLLDEDSNGKTKIHVYTPTDYCNTIMNALHNENEHNYSESIDYWEDVLTLNNNFDLAYIGIGKALYSQGKYDEAIEMLKKAYETEYASKAFAEMRKDIVGKWVLLIVAAVIVVMVLFVKFLGYAKKRNKAAVLKVGRKSYWEELLYPFHLVFHPFDGFWDLKHEKRGSVRAATTIMGITILAFFYNSIGKGYLHNPRGAYSTIFVQILSIAVPVLLWTVANWCLTTLFDGEGSFKDIYIATCYSLAPLPLFVVISTLLTNVMTVTEGSIVTLLITFGFIWTALLLFFGTLVTHDYSLGKNFITVLGTIVAMVVIMFVAILFSTLVVKMVTFIVTLVTELLGRV